ncbi:MAG: GNAT family N-acetyltransferase [Clostridiales bacterium]|nr:GNAT family N-acetyltransferase [Clostridiales bacterium]
MIKAPSVFLCNRVSAHDARKLADWLDNPAVNKFLNEGEDVSSALRDMAHKNDPLLTYHLNQEGRFYLVRKSEDDPVGFVRLQPNEDEQEHEIVIAIGERSIWGHGIGTIALRQILYMAFYEWRTKKIIAKIHHSNHRSIRLFTNAGFVVEQELPKIRIYSLTSDRYISAAAKRA